MEKISYLLFICLLFSCSKTQSPTDVLEMESQKKIPSVSKKKIPRLPNNYETVNVQGKVKSIICTNYQQSVQNSELSYLVTKVDYKFDEKGNVVDQVTHLADGESNHYKYFYDDFGNRTKSIKLDQNNKKIVVAISLLNEKGSELNSKSMELVKTKDYQDTIISIESITKFRLATDSIEDYISYRKHTPKDFIRNIDYYSDGRLIRNVTIGVVKTISIYQYDNQNNKIMQTESYPDSDSIARIWHYTYDKNNRETSWKIENYENKYRGENKKSYDDYGNITEEVHVENGKINEKISYKYVYVYDLQNNWIKQYREKLNGGKVSLLERKITYY